MALMHVCDRCGRMIEQQKGASLGEECTAFGISIQYNKPFTNFDGHKTFPAFNLNLDLCDKCMKEIISYIFNEREFVPSRYDKPLDPMEKGIR